MTLTQVRRFVNNSAYYARGRTYAQEGRVTALGQEETEEGIRYSARVLGRGEVYAVSAQERQGELAACACTCPAFARTGTMCKHVAAMLIAICESRQKEARLEVAARVREQARLEAEQRERMQEESRQLFLDTLMQRARQRRADGVRRRHEAAGDVRLYPILRLEAGQVSLALRLGRTRAYVVHSMAQFGRGAARQTCERYGKELVFSYTEEEIDPRDIALFRQAAAIAQRCGTQSPEAPVETGMLDALMRTLLGREVEMRTGDGQARSAQVVEGSGKIKARIRRSGGLYHVHVIPERVARGMHGVYFFCPEEGELRCAFGTRYDAAAPLLELAERFPQGVELEETRFEQLTSQVLAPAGACLNVTRGRELLLSHAPMAMHPRFLVDMQGRERLVCEVVFDYGAADVRAGEEHPHIRRDSAAEEEACLCAQRLFPIQDAPGRYAFEGNGDAVFTLLSERLAQLGADGEVMISDRLRQMNVERRRAITFGVTKSGVQLMVQADLGGLTQPELEAAYAAYRQRRRYVRLTDGTFLSGEALQQAAETAQVLQGLGLSAEELAGGANVPMNRAMYLEAALRERESLSLSAPGEVEDFVRRLESARQAEAEPPAGLTATLRPYQRAGFSWLCALRDAGFGGILADDMGLGKTLQALCLLLRDKELGRPLRALVVCPASLQLNWLSEAARFVPGLRCEVLAGTASQRRERITAQDAPEVLITSYDQLRRDAQAYHGVHLTHVLLDEAQNIKNAASQGAKAAKALTADCRFAMTGTPIENRLSELWSIFDFLMPGYLPAYKRFRERFEAPIVQEEDAQARENLRLLVAPFILRRMKRDVLTDLPEKVETVLASELMPEQRRLYAAHAAALAGELETGADDDARRRMQLLAGITRLRQLCCDPALCLEGYAGGSGKLEQCMELVQEAVQGGHSLLLFSQFTGMLDILAGRLREAGIPAFLLVGGTPKEERMRLVEAFNAGEARVFLISLKAGGTGLNLTGADMVVHYDPWWNTAAQNQATDRAYRIGQTRGVQVIRLIASGTIEERILRLQQQKAELSDGVLAGGEGAGALDEETMRALLL